MINRILGALGRILIFSGIVLLLFVGYQLWGTGLDESAHQDELNESLATTLGVTAQLPAGEDDPAVIADKITEELASVDPKTAPPAVAPPEGESGGLIEIPKIGLRRKNFVEGVTKADLRKGPGHYPGTPLPGNAGNAAIAGHRTTYGAPFNRIDELVPGDKITTYTAQGKFVYEVLESPESRRSGPQGENWDRGWFAVVPKDVSVLAPSETNMLTLTACHPELSAKLRIIVQAKLIAEPAASPTTTTAPTQPTKVTTPASPEPAAPPPTTETAEDLIAGDSSELAPALMFGGVVIALWLLAMAIAATLRRREIRWWPVYVLCVAATIAPLWLCFVHMDRFLPSY